MDFGAPMTPRFPPPKHEVMYDGGTRAERNYPRHQHAVRIKSKAEGGAREVQSANVCSEVLLLRNSMKFLKSLNLHG